MGFDLAIGDLIGSLFADVAPEVAAGATDFAAPAIGDLAGAAAAAGGDIAAGVGGDIAAGLPDLAAADVSAAGTGALDLGGLAPATVEDTLAAAVPEAVDITAGGSLGEAGGTGALSFAPTSADAALTPGAAGPGASSAITAASGANPAIAAPGATVDPATELATGNPNLASLIENQAPGGAPVSGPSTATTALGNQTIPGNVTQTLENAGGSVDTAAASAPSSLESQVGSVLNSPITKGAELALPLAFLGYNAAKGPAPIPTAATAAVTNAQTQLLPLEDQAQQNVPLFNSTAATDLSLATNFQISPAQAAAISTWQQNQYNQLYQQIANMGITDVQHSSEWVQGKNQIDQQALAQQVQMVKQLITTAFQAASAANAGVSTATNVTSSLDATLMQAAQLQVQQDQAFQQALSSAMQSFGLLAGLSSLKSNNSNATATA